MDVIHSNSSKVPNENRSFKNSSHNHKYEPHSFGKSESNRSDFKISSSLPNSALNIIPTNQSNIQSQKIKEYHHSNNDRSIQMEPLMSINIKENSKKSQYEESINHNQSNNDYGISNPNNNNKQHDNQHQQDNLQNSNLEKIEQEFEKNYVFKMKKVLIQQDNLIMCLQISL